MNRPTEIRFEGRRYVWIRAAAPLVGYTPEALHTFVQQKQLPAVIQGRRKYVCWSALQRALQPASLPVAAQVAGWLKAHPGATWESARDLAGQLVKAGIAVTPEQTKRILHRLGRVRAPLHRRILAWLETDSARRFLPRAQMRSTLEQALKRPICGFTLTRAIRAYDARHGDPHADFDPTCWASVKEAAQLLCIRRNTLEDHVAHGKFTVQRRLNRTYISRASLAAWQARQATRRTRKQQIGAYFEAHPEMLAAPCRLVAAQLGCHTSLVWQVKRDIQARCVQR